jgi:hypothetical protein
MSLGKYLSGGVLVPWVYGGQDVFRDLSSTDGWRIVDAGEWLALGIVEARSRCHQCVDDGSWSEV